MFKVLVIDEDEVSNRKITEILKENSKVDFVLGRIEWIS